MATSSGNTTNSSSGSEGHFGPIILDERKRKRMESNRESARRSRVRKQQLVNDLTAEIAQLKKENNQVAETINVTSQKFLIVESENSILRAQMSELSQRLDSLNGIVNDMNALSVVGSYEVDGLGILGDLGMMDGLFGNFGHNVDYNPWNLGFMNQQPIMASANGLLY